MMKRSVIVMASDRRVQLELRASAEFAGFGSFAAADTQSLSADLYRDPDAIGVVRVSDGGIAAALCREFRQAEIRNILFVLIDASECSHEAIARSLAAGADDAQPAPIDRREFEARLKALARRGPYNDHLKVRMPGCTFIADSGLCHGEGKSVRLSPAEGSVLTTLAMNPGRPVTKAELMDHLYGGENEPEEKIIDVLVCKLRKKLAEMNGGLEVVQTVWGRGYQFVPEGFEQRYRMNVRVPR